MANPQIENGHTDIANELLEALAKIRIPGECMQVLLTIFRQTYGWHKKEEVIPLSTFVKSTGMGKPNICRALSKLITMCVVKKDNRNGFIAINKDFDAWKPLSKLITLSKLTTSVIKNDNNPLSKLTTSKTISTKEKRLLSGKIELPDCIDSSPVVQEKKKVKPSLSDPVEIIISYLNEKTGKHYHFHTAGTKYHIQGRLKEGFTPDDFKEVIDIKVKEWKDDKHWSKFLRPETLFCAKHFESYLNESHPSGNPEEDDEEVA